MKFIVFVLFALSQVAAMDWFRTRSKDEINQNIWERLINSINTKNLFSFEIKSMKKNIAALPKKVLDQRHTYDKFLNHQLRIECSYTCCFS